MENYVFTLLAFMGGICAFAMVKLMRRSFLDINVLYIEDKDGLAGFNVLVEDVFSKFENRYLNCLCLPARIIYLVLNLTAIGIWTAFKKM